MSEFAQPSRSRQDDPAPDDDPECLFRLVRDIQRKRREDERRAQEQRKSTEDEGTNPAEDSGDEAS